MPNFVEQHCSENHASQNNLLRIALDVREVHSILNNGDRERSDQCAEHFPFAATETGTANNDGGDNIQLVHVAVRRRTAFELRRHNDSAESRQQSTCDVREHQHTPPRNAGQTNRLAIDADGNITESDWAALDAADAILMGSPTYMGSVSWQFKKFADASSKQWMSGAWKDKVAGGFTISANLSGDKLSTLQYFITLSLQLGMV